MQKRSLKILRMNRLVMKNLRGQGLTEYALVLSFIALGCIFAGALFGQAMRAKFSEMTLALSGADTSEAVSIQREAGRKSKEKAKVLDGWKISESEYVKD
jgi:pilus assembly protein Flp/PilA